MKTYKIFMNSIKFIVLLLSVVCFTACSKEQPQSKLTVKYTMYTSAGVFHMVYTHIVEGTSYEIYKESNRGSNIVTAVQQDAVFGNRYRIYEGTSDIHIDSYMLEQLN